jgi:hypothetical protein
LQKVRARPVFFQSYMGISNLVDRCHYATGCYFIKSLNGYSPYLNEQRNEQTR